MGSARDLEGDFEDLGRAIKPEDDADDDEREPTTESDSEGERAVAGGQDSAGVGSSSRGGGQARTMPQEGQFGMAFPGPGDDDDEGEPDTEPSGDEAPFLPQAGSSRGARAVPEAALSPTVLDLTDDGDDSSARAEPFESTSTARPGRTADHLSLNDDDDDDVQLIPSASISSKDKGKARAVSFPPPSADQPTTTPPDADTEPPRSLAHLSCPICLGPPTPLALTSCGHAFCAPCLHAALVAGPALTPPPPDTSTRGRRGRGAAYAAAASSGIFTSRGRGRGARGGAAGGAAAGQPSSDDDGDPELNKHCPVCRTPLYGGWGKSLRGLVVRMGPAKR
ncbi:hypothetical protein JCM5296_003727 [Sporobolomyces johnsonii]